MTVEHGFFFVLLAIAVYIVAWAFNVVVKS